MTEKKIMLIQIEPNLLSFSDHYYNYSQYIKAECIKRSIEYVCICNLKVDINIVDKFMIPRLKFFSFNKNLFKVFFLSKSLNAVINNFYFSFDLFLRLRSYAKDIKGKKIVFFSTAIKPYQIWAFYWLNYIFDYNLSLCINTLELLESNKKKKLRFINSIYNKKTIFYLKLLIEKGNVKIFSDSELIKANLDNQLGNSSSNIIGLLPIPGIKTNQESCVAQDSLNKSEDITVSIVYLGSPRIEKGFIFLVEYLKSFSVFNLKKEINFQVQINRSPEFSKLEMTAVDELIKACSEDENIKTFEGPLNQMDYAKKVNQADIILLPYYSERYELCTSGLLADALANGKIVIVPRGTWMEFVITNIGYGFTFERNNLKSFHNALAEATMWMKENFNNSVKQDIIYNWEKYNQTEHLLDRIIQKI